MSTRKAVLADSQSALTDRLAASLEQARRGDLAEGSGEDAIRRAFAAALRTHPVARQKRGGPQDHR